MNKDIEEEENKQIKLSLDLEISVVGMKINLPKERIEFLHLQSDNQALQIFFLYRKRSPP